MSADKQTRSKNRKSRSDFQRLRRRFMSGLLRSLFLINKPLRPGQAGFVLPTTVLLLLVLTLTMGALSFRAFSRSGSVIALREQQVIDSAASPAIDRAKSKLEYLFTRDSRFPGGVPSSDVIASMMLNDGVNAPVNPTNDPYTFPQETRVDVNGGGVDNAWVFPTDVDGNGSVDPGELVVYSILMDDTNGGVFLTDNQNSAKANALVTRNGPISTSEAQTGCASARAPEAGWQAINAATLEKNFQVTAFVANGSTVNRTASAIELQQVRQADRGNKWGAWFKYDLELFPGASRDFFWNGAMHTEGNLLVRDKYKARMISSHNSCLYNEPASEVTLSNPSNPPFQGQLLSAKVDVNNFSGSSSNNDSPGFHLFTANGQAPDTASNNSRLGTDNDSVNASQEHLRNILLDPIQLFTKNVLANRSTAGWSRNTAWNNRRIFNNPSAVPYLDDTYRADDRYGPKAVYDKNNAIPAGTPVGAPITSDVALTNIDPSNSLYGLDGYWERRAIGQGLRIVVGQRLELGNTFGWKGATETDADPLHPPNIDTLTEARQRRSLYDNLAAVQGMVVYHHETDTGTYPLACVASTAHPGTAQTLINSRNFTAETFKNAANSDVTSISNFLTGKGTNGWEYNFPDTFLPSTGGTAESFGAALAETKPLGIALRNLAHFAGDPKGGAPSFEPVQDLDSAIVHPYPNMAMWGDYSVLRRIFDDQLDASAVGSIADRYDALSPADKSSLHSAACTMGLLGKNVAYASSISDNSVDWIKTLLPPGYNLGSDADNIRDNLNLSGQKIVDALGMKGISPPNGSWAKNNCTEVPSGSKNWDCTGAPTASIFFPPTKEEVLDLIPTGNPLSPEVRRFIDLLSNTSQILRDRKYGSETPSAAYTAMTILGDPTTKYKVNLPNDCIPGSGASPSLNDLYGPSFDPNDINRSKLLGFATMCSSKPKYPSLHYLFPVASHNQTPLTGAVDSYVYDHKGTPSLGDDTGENKDVMYKIVGDDNQNGIEDPGELGMGAIAFNHRTTWRLPRNDTATSGTLNPETMQIIDTDGTLDTVALLDKGMYDGREMLGLRMLDLDINQLSSNPSSGDRWISEEDGIVYAFREDAIREDAIVRPKDSTTSWTDCDAWDKVYTNSSSNNYQVVGNNRNCRLSRLTSAISPPFLQDPPLVTDTRISTKPIDFYADPDRRPYGFRLINGATLNRPSNVSTGLPPVLAGMTFVSDNMVYVKGDFNLHQAYSSTFDPTSGSACTGLIEEFTDKLVSSACNDRTQPTTVTGGENMNFYSDRMGDERNEDNFAKPAQDQWRPVEIVGDAVGVLSRAFKDGNIQDGFTLVRNQSSSVGNGTSSYQNQNRLSNNSANAPNYWRHVNPTPSGVTTPILINRNGGVIRNTTGFPPLANNQYLTFTENLFNDKRGGDLQAANRTIVNAVFISGIIPSQAGQTYGGMHNFLRFLEHWNGVDLHVSGGLFQLNFSTSATAPFDQDAWEPGTDAQVGSERIRFYGAPNRLWGYDVGLQYAPAGPIARRFVTIGRSRSEFYRELPVDDPYVANLRCAVYPNGGGRVYPNETPCP